MKLIRNVTRRLLLGLGVVAIVLLPALTALGQPIVQVGHIPGGLGIRRPDDGGHVHFPLPLEGYGQHFGRHH